MREDGHGAFTLNDPLNLAHTVQKVVSADLDFHDSSAKGGPEKVTGGF